MNKMIFASLGLLVALGGCMATGSGSESGAQQAASTQTAATDQQQRAKVHTELGSLYLLDGRSAIALEEARIAIAADANYAPAYNLLALTHMGLNELKQAEENFQKALRLAPGDPEISNNYGWFLCQTGREQQAIGYFMAAAKNPLYTTPTKPYTNAGICAFRVKNDIEKAMEPTAEVLWMALRAERKLGNREAEARYALQLRRRFPGSPEQELLSQGQYD